MMDSSERLSLNSGHYPTVLVTLAAEISEKTAGMGLDHLQHLLDIALERKIEDQASFEALQTATTDLFDHTSNNDILTRLKALEEAWKGSGIAIKELYLVLFDYIADYMEHENIPLPIEAVYDEEAFQGFDALLDGVNHLIRTPGYELMALPLVNFVIQQYRQLLTRAWMYEEATGRRISRAEDDKLKLQIDDQELTPEKIEEIRRLLTFKMPQDRPFLQNLVEAVAKSQQKTRPSLGKFYTYSKFVKNMWSQMVSAPEATQEVLAEFTDLAAEALHIQQTELVHYLIQVAVFNAVLGEILEQDVPDLLASIIKYAQSHTDTIPQEIVPDKEEVSRMKTRIRTILLGE